MSAVLRLLISFLIFIMCTFTHLDYAKLECPVVSNNSAHRWTEDVPMVVPEINADHIKVIEAQRKRLGTKRGFIAVKSNCSLQSYIPALHPLMKYRRLRRNAHNAYS